jgi:peroxiredoxin Q/BCP
MAAKRATTAGKAGAKTESKTSGWRGAKARKPKTKSSAAGKTKPAAERAASTRSAPRGPLVEGSRAPSFRLLDKDAQVFDSYALEGKPYVLYFYPKDDTPGCTKEACDFRDALPRLARRKLQVIGVSPDAPGAHARFADKYALPFRLLSDSERELAKKYGVWVKKQNYGREYMGIERSTFLIGADGVIKRVWRGVRVPGHIDNVLAEAAKLS